MLKEVEKHSAPKGTFRKSKKPDKYSGLIANLNTVTDSEPFTFFEASKHQVWKDAMNEEYDSILKNNVWTVVPRPHGKSVVTSKWFYKIKHAADGSIEKYKARFVARGFSLKEGIDYDEIFAPVDRYTSIRIIRQLGLLSLLQQLLVGNFTKWMLRLLFLTVKLNKKYTSSSLKFS
jgi:hypothetical protein